MNEPAMADAANRLRGEWTERSGGELSATSKNWKDIAGAKQLDADVVIFPSRYMGELSLHGWIQPVRGSVLESEEFNVGDIFPLVRRQLMRWGGQTMALPLGASLSFGNVGHDHPGLALLATVAPDVVSGEGEPILFDPQTMKPHIADSTFVKGLQQLAMSGGIGTGNGTDFAHWIPVFGFADPMVAVTAETRNGASASKLIAWLASAEIGTQLARTGSATFPVRRSVPVSANAVGRDADKTNAKSFADEFATAMNADKCLLVPRISGVDDYIAALDTAVPSTLEGKSKADAALKTAAEAWEQVTNRLGREKQREAYLKSLGIE